MAISYWKDDDDLERAKWLGMLQAINTLLETYDKRTEEKISENVAQSGGNSDPINVDDEEESEENEVEGATELLPFAAGKKHNEGRKVARLKTGKGVQEKRVSATQFHYL